MSVLWRKPQDPGGNALRRGVIAATATTVLFAFGLFVLGNTTFALFAAFSAFATSGLVYFGGPTAKRARAYAAFTLTCVVLLAIGTALSNWLVGGVIGMLVVGFSVRFVSVFGGYIAAGANAVLLAFVLPVMVSATAGASYVPRIGGWLVGGTLGAFAVIVFVPDRSRLEFRVSAAKICRDAAHCVLHNRDPLRAEHDHPKMVSEVAANARELTRRWASMPLHPAGPTLSDQAYLIILDQLSRLVPALKQDELQEEHAEVRELGAPLRASVVDTLRGAADLLEHGRGDARTSELDAARVSYRETMRDWVDGRLPGVDRYGSAPASASVADTIVRRVEEGFGLLLISHQALSIGANAMLMARKAVHLDPNDLDPDMPEGGRSALGTAARAERVLRAHLRLSDQTFRVALRTGIVLALAVYVGDQLGFSHKFWVVLGAMTVLRSSASGTGATGLQAGLGTAIGFVLSSGVVLLTESEPSWLWLALVFCTFLAAWAPTTISFMVGQAAFTLFVVVLFSIEAPQGLGLGLQRLEAMAAGVAVAVVGGFALWPRGAKGLVGTCVAHLYRTSVRHLDANAYAFVSSTDADSPCAGSAGIELDTPRAEASEARWRADDAYAGFAGEQRASGEVLVAWVRVMCVPATARLIADALRRLASRGYASCDCPDAIAAVGAELQRVEAMLERVASRLLHPTDSVPVSWGSQVVESRAAIVECLTWQLDRPDDERQSVLGLLFMLEGLYMLDGVLTNVAEPLDLVCADLVG